MPCRDDLYDLADNPFTFTNNNFERLPNEKSSQMIFFSGTNALNLIIKNNIINLNNKIESLPNDYVVFYLFKVDNDELYVSNLESSENYISPYDEKIIQNYENSMWEGKIISFSELKTGDPSSSKFFSKSSVFSNSFNFTNSAAFTNSNKFKQTQNFSNSQKFSSSIEFSSSGKFSNSKKFQKSDKFSSSFYFSNSAAFTNSKKFKQTESFSSSQKFSKSNPFSYSNQFSPSSSLEPLPNAQKCILYENDDETLLNECKFVENQEKFAYVYVLLSNFSHIKQEEGNGSAVHLINCGIQCNYTNFIDCISTSGGGGAIYIENKYDMINNITLIGSLFYGCKALYGGALYIYSSSDLLNVSLTRCCFEANEALLKRRPTSDKIYLFGGSAVFFNGPSIYIIECKFASNIGQNGAFKIANTIEEKRNKIQLEKSENSICFIGCIFEQDENSQNSIYYSDQKENKSSRKVDVLNCEFKGKLKMNSFYIRGKFNDKEKLHVKSCIFENNVNAMNVELIDDEESFIEGDLKTNVLIIYSLMIITFFIFFLSFYNFKKFTKDESDLNPDENYLNSKDQV